MKFIKQFSEHGVYFKTLNLQFIELGQKILEEYQNLKDLEIMLLDKTLHDVEVIEMIKILDLKEFLNNSLVENFVSGFWFGPYE